MNYWDYTVDENGCRCVTYSDNRFSFSFESAESAKGVEIAEGVARLFIGDKDSPDDMQLVFNRVFLPKHDLCDHTFSNFVNGFVIDTIRSARFVTSSVFDYIKATQSYKFSWDSNSYSLAGGNNEYDPELSFSCNVNLETGEISGLYFDLNLRHYTNIQEQSFRYDIGSYSLAADPTNKDEVCDELLSLFRNKIVQPFGVIVLGLAAVPAFEL